MKTKKAQAWGFDLIIATSVFIFGIIFFYIYLLNYSTSESDFKILYEEAEFIAESLLSEGYPINWNENNVSRIGLLSENTINETKLEMFYNLANSNYAFTKSLFEVRDNYYVNFTAPISISSGNIEGVGLQTANPKNLVTVTRIVSYNGTIVNLKIEVWN